MLVHKRIYDSRFVDVEEFDVYEKENVEEFLDDHDRVRSLRFYVEQCKFSVEIDRRRIH